jgi:hypothetical protein
MSDQGPTTEQRILQAVYRVLIDVIKDTTTDPRLKHPLTDHTKEAIRDCLDLITARQAELAREAGHAVGVERPYYADEPAKGVTVPVDLNALRRGLKRGQDD